MFTDPTFDSKNECMSFLMNNGLITQRENNTGIRLSKTDRSTVNCMRKQDFLDIINGLTKT